jgi:hypothetical protein
MQTKMREEFNHLTERLSAFGEKAKRVLTRNKDHAGQYANLNESLLDEEENDHTEQGDYFTGTGGGSSYRVNSSTTNSNNGRGRERTSDAMNNNLHLNIPSEAEMMVQTTSLAKEAAELLWETIAFQSGCAESEKDPQMVEQMADLADKATSLTSQLRGLIRNHLSGASEGISESMLADALEVKDMLDACLGEYKETQQQPQQVEEESGKKSAITPAAAGGGLKKSNNVANANANVNGNSGLDAVQGIQDAPLIQLDYDEDVLPPPARTTPADVQQQQQQQLPQSTPARTSVVDPFSNAFDTLQFGSNK